MRYLLTYAFWGILCLSCQSNLNSSVEQFQSFQEDHYVDSISNFVKEINGIHEDSWTNIIHVETYETTEGGNANLCFQNEDLTKIEAFYYGETFQNEIEFFVKDKQLVYAVESLISYNRPFYYDEEMMIENGDTEFFDFEKSIIITNEYTFHSDSLIRFKSDNSNNPIDTLELQNVIKSHYRKLIKSQ